MPVQPIVGGCDVAVLVDGLKLPEYNAPELDAEGHDNQLKQLVGVNQAADPALAASVAGIAYIRKYVEANSGKRFTIRFDKAANTPRGCHHLGIEVELDGFKSGITHEPMKPSNPEAHWGFSCGSFGTGSARDGFYWEFFKFGDVQTTDDNPLSNDETKRLAAEVKRLGVLRVYLYQMMEAPTLVYNPRDIFNAPNEVNEVIPEKALKGRAVTLSTRFDRERGESAPPAQPADRFLCADKLPCAIWEFQYRSKDGLVQEGVIPSTGNPGLNDPSHVQSQQQPLVVGGFRRRGLHRVQKPAHVRYKETRRHDGKVQIELESDDDEAADAITTAEVRESTTRNIEIGANRGMPMSYRQSPGATSQRVASGDPSQEPNPRYRARCETVEDEESHRRPSMTNPPPADCPVQDDEMGYDTDETVL